MHGPRRRSCRACGVALPAWRGPGAASARAGRYDAGQGRDLLRGRAHSDDPPGRRAQRSAQPQRAAEVPGAAGWWDGLHRARLDPLRRGWRARRERRASCCAARRGARHGPLEDLAGLKHDDPPGQNGRGRSGLGIAACRARFVRTAKVPRPRSVTASPCGRLALMAARTASMAFSAVCLGRSWPPPSAPPGRLSASGSAPSPGMGPAPPHACTVVKHVKYLAVKSEPGGGGGSRPRAAGGGQRLDGQRRRLDRPPPRPASAACLVGVHPAR